MFNLIFSDLEIALNIVVAHYEFSFSFFCVFMFYVCTYVCMCVCVCVVWNTGTLVSESLQVLYRHTSPQLKRNPGSPNSPNSPNHPDLITITLIILSAMH